MSKSDFGLIGLAVMGQNLVLNVESRGFQVSVYNRTTSTMKEFVEANPGKKLYGAETLEDFVASLERPRKIMIMVKSTAATDINDRDAVDAVIESLIPLLEEGDLLIDGGNTYFIHSDRRAKDLGEKGILFIGTGVSGGEEGALKGPSIMPGGPEASWEIIKPVFEAIAAKVGDDPCVTHIGEGGAGHYVKMVHNGIEYGDMQLICEAYQIFKAAGFTADEMAEVFADWNKGELESYLIQITSKIFEEKDAETGKPLVDVILDRAGQKGTGRWTILNAVDNAVVASTINAAVEARILSAIRDQRLAAAPVFEKPEVKIDIPKEELIQKVHDALYASKVISYAQGMDLIKTVGERQNWNLNLGGIAKIWRGGCIIRARFLNRITEAFERDADLTNLMLDPFFTDILNRSQSSWREVVTLAVNNAIPVPAFSASLSYFDSYRSERLPANLLQAQRDFFGAHTYERLDKPEGEFFHTDWPDVVED
ncbi:MAG: phosphogluconate dehydrogenase (NADP(+)-dependent, decarboxylating) [Verrucomicrobiales bacterium]|nr:phosphogluconate dehydrogenase (NADP(+)-dependent, decarboxylating) [Verrucomicrobiales bacterium]